MPIDSVGLCICIFAKVMRMTNLASAFCEHDLDWFLLHLKCWSCSWPCINIWILYIDGCNVWFSWPVATRFHTHIYMSSHYGRNSCVYCWNHVFGLCCYHATVFIFVMYGSITEYFFWRDKSVKEGDLIVQGIDKYDLVSMNLISNIIKQAWVLRNWFENWVCVFFESCSW